MPTPAPSPAIANFTDVAEKAGLTALNVFGGVDTKKYIIETTGTGVAIFDYDNDGWPDIFVVNGTTLEGFPANQTPTNHLYHNNHDGTFTDVSMQSGVGKPLSKGMGVVLADFDNDGWPDIAIANDTWPNFLFLNNHDGTFRDASFDSGIAASEDGRYEAGMGIDAADVDGDGLLEIYVTHLALESNRLYKNNRNGSFDDISFAAGIGGQARFLSGVAAQFLDYDNDGWEDILQLNGAMEDNIQLYQPGISYPEPKLMFRNLGHGRFEVVSAKLGPDFLRPVVGRGLAVGDFDNDGNLDFVTNNRGDYPELLRNDGGSGNNWLTVRLIGSKSNRDGIGSSIRLVAEGFAQVKQSKGGMSYMSASDPRIHFGLGKRVKIESLEVTWPSGIVDKINGIAANQFVTVKEGMGIVPGNFQRVRWKS